MSNSNRNSNSPISVLAVEDVPVAQTSIVSLLEHLGCEVTVAGTGNEGIDATKNKLFDLIFMDIGLPDLDVLTVTEAIQKNYQALTQTVPVIVALTAHGSENIKTQCFKAGMQDFLVKPLTLDTAKVVLEKYIT